MVLVYKGTLRSRQVSLLSVKTALGSRQNKARLPPRAAREGGLSVSSPPQGAGRRAARSIRSSAPRPPEALQESLGATG